MKLEKPAVVVWLVVVLGFFLNLGNVCLLLLLSVIGC